MTKKAKKVAIQAKTSKSKASGLAVVDEVKAEGSKVSKKKTGRKRRVFTIEQEVMITQMALDNCHVDTIALALSIPKQTLVRRFGTFISQKRAEGRTMLRRAQREKALIGKDTGMLCFLGKNELNQTDKQTTELNLSKETATLLGLIDGSSKGKLPTSQEK